MRNHITATNSPLVLFLSVILALLWTGCRDDEISKLPEAIGGGVEQRVLLIDDDEGVEGTFTGAPGTPTWESTLDALGVSYDVEELAINGDSTSNLSDYSVVIWTVGASPVDNLTANNIAQLQSYLDSGGRLLYAGGHNVYSETQAGASNFIDTYLGLAFYSGNMPTIIDTGAPVPTTGQGHPTVGSATYNLWYWPGAGSGLGECGAECGNMFSGFNIGLPTATGLLDIQGVNLSGGSGYFAAANVAGSYRTITWGFDINYVDPADQAQLLGNALFFLVQ